MPPPLLELWGVALRAAQNAVIAGLRAHLLLPEEAAAERRLLEHELRWLAAHTKF